MIYSGAGSIRDCNVFACTPVLDECVMLNCLSDVSVPGRLRSI